MAEPIALFLTLNGTAVEGDSTATSLGRENSIEVLSFRQVLSSAFERGSGRATGRRFYEPLEITKRVDRSSPLLRNGLARNEVAEAEFRWYRPNPSGDGTTQHFFTISCFQGRITTVKTILPNVLDPALASHPAYEEIHLVFNRIRVNYADTVEVEDEWVATV